MLKIKYIIIFTIAFPVNSCKKENLGDCFKPTGAIETRIIEVSDFKHVVVFDKIDLHVSQGPNFEVKLEAGKNLFMNIKTTVRNDTLTIDNINKCNFVRSPKKKIVAYVTLPYLRMVRNAGTGNVYFDNQFTQDSLDIRVANSGDVHFNVNVQSLHTSTHGNGDLYGSGTVFYSTHYTNGTNYLRLQDMTVQSRIDVNTYTIGDCYINAPTGGYMKVEIWEKGNVRYKGSPGQVELKRYSKGDLIQE
ncbi:MAG: DUF2807 domain-containing protein [Sphingobacteriaceae bacterium]|nr:DUF2807 domain-containing protein [Sphingobacteriaceae bacterium]